jgi:hypothetical protein
MGTKFAPVGRRHAPAEARVRAVIEAACQQLQAATARAFRLLALCPGPEVTTGLAATVLDVPAPARKLVEDLVMAGFIESAGCGWWRFHELAYLHAQEQAQWMESGLVVRAVTSRVLSWHVHAAIGAHADLPGSGHAQPVTYTAPAVTRNPKPGCAPEPDLRCASLAGSERRPLRCAVPHGSGLSSASTTSSQPRCASSAAYPPPGGAGPKP